MDTAEKLKRLALTWKPYKYCYFSTADKNGCSKKIVNAHTVQKNGALSKISTNGHVRFFKPTFQNLTKNKGSLEPVLEGVKKASTFFGFCESHDKQIFSPIEDFAFKDCEEHSLLIGYRAVCKEIHAKSEQMRMHVEIDNILKDDLRYSDQLRQREPLYRGMQLAESELNSLKSEMENLIVGNNYQGVNYVSIRSSIFTEYMCSGALIPEISFDGGYIQHLGTPKSSSSYLSVNIFSSDTDGIIVFQWLGDSPSNVRFISGLLKKDVTEIPKYITRFVFESLENTFISPAWWNSLSAQDKKIIKTRVMSFSDHKENCLSEGRIASVNWNINTIKTNVDELKAFER